MDRIAISFTAKDQNVTIRFSPKYELFTSVYILILPDRYTRLSKSIWSNEADQWRGTAREKLGEKKLDALRDIIPVFYSAIEWNLCLMMKNCENAQDVNVISQYLNKLSDFHLLRILFNLSSREINEIRRSCDMRPYEKKYGVDVASCMKNWVLNTKRSKDSLVRLLTDYWNLEFEKYYFETAIPKLTERGKKQIEDINSIGLRTMENLLGVSGVFQNIIFSPTFFLKMSAISVTEKEGTVIICPSDWSGEHFIWTAIYEMLSSLVDKTIVDSKETKVVSYLDALQEDKDVFQEYLALEDCLKLSWGWRGWVANWFKQAYMKYACVKKGLATLENMENSLKTKLEKKFFRGMMLYCRDEINPTSCFLQVIAGA